MKRILVLLAAVVAIATVATAPARQQLLRNGSYETATLIEDVLVPDFWTQFGGASQSAVTASDGMFSGLVSVRTNAFVGFYQDPPAATATLEGTHILMKARAFVPIGASFGPQGVAGMKLEFYPPGGGGVPPPVENLSFTVASPVDVWTPVTVSSVVPPDISFAKCVIISFDTDEMGMPVSNGPVYADNCFAERSSQPTVNQLMNPNFADGTGSSGPSGLAPIWFEFADPGSSARKNCFGGTSWLSPNCGVLFTGGTTAGLYQQIPVNPGETLTFTANFLRRSDSTPPPGNDPDVMAGVKIEWVAGNVPTPQIDVVPNANPVSGTTNIVNQASPRGQWLPLSIDYTMPVDSAAALRGTVINAFGTGSTDCDVYFDSFEMVFTNVFNGSDADGDNDEDLLDIADLQKSFTGVGGGLNYGGLVFDHDEDTDVDVTDSNFTLDRLVGPALP